MLPHVRRSYWFKVAAAILGRLCIASGPDIWAPRPEFGLITLTSCQPFTAEYLQDTHMSHKGLVFVMTEAPPTHTHTKAPPFFRLQAGLTSQAAGVCLWKQATVPACPCQPEEHSAGLLPEPQRPSFTNLCNGCANDAKAAGSSDGSNLDATVITCPLHAPEISRPMEEHGIRKGKSRSCTFTQMRVKKKKSLKQKYHSKVIWSIYFFSHFSQLVKVAHWFFLSEN